ncbi:MAG: WYL domain-containing protein [Propionibacteriaceae bacterium]|nr:WYL domain-containing protein [Propionibacteriaceae bacterium]
MKSTEQLARLLKLVPYLQKNQGISVASVASHFGVSERQVVSDIEVLQFCGLPEGFHGDLFEVDIDEVREDGHIYFANADVLARPMRMRLQEATSLLVALDMLVEASGGSEAASSALAKLRALVGEIDPAVSVSVAAGDPGHRQLLQEAISGRRLVELTHLGAGRAPESRPAVEPIRLRVTGGFAYLDGWSRPRSAWRSYRLDRIQEIRVLDEVFEPRVGLPAVGDDWFDDVVQQLEVTLAPQAHWVTEYYPVITRDVHADHLQVTFPVASPQWATALLLRLGEAVLSVSDEQVARVAAHEARSALLAYADAPD